MNGTNKSLIALLVVMMTVFCVMTGLTVQVLNNVYAQQPQPQPDQGATEQSVPASTTAPDTNQNAPVNSDAVQNTTEPTPDAQPGQPDQPAANQTPDVSAMTDQQILDMLTNAANKTKAYSGSVSVHRVDKFDVNVVECTGGSAVAGILNRVIGVIVSPADENLTFNGGTAVSSDGENLVILNPQKGDFRLQMSGVSSISASKNGDNTVINVTLVPESVGLKDVPAANSSGIGYLDIGSFDLSFVTITSASFDYKGSTIKATINPDGYVTYIEYNVPLDIVGNAKIGFDVTAVIEAAETEIWEFNW